jgi:glycosyltransferase involved in cell wall biosynthesis
VSPTLPPGFTLLQVTPRLVGGGVERATLDMAAAVTEAGFRSIVATWDGGDVDELDGEFVRLPVHSRNPVVMLANVRRLTRLIREERVSLVHVRSRAPAFSAIAAARRAGVPAVATYHGIYSAASPLKRWYNGVMTRGDLVIANSNFTRDHILDEHSVPPDLVVVVPEGIDTAWFDPAAVSVERIAAVRAAWGLAADDRRRVLLCAARLTAWKGQGTAIQAFAARARRENAVLILAGREESATYATALRALAAELGVAKSVVFVGPTLDMPAALLAADIVLAPSTKAESFGRVVVEAMAMGRPVVASAIGAHLGTVEDGVSGWLVPPDDPAAWTRAMDAALAMPASAEASRDRAVSLYGLDAMVEGTFEVYRRLLETHA